MNNMNTLEMGKTELTDTTTRAEAPKAPTWVIYQIRHRNPFILNTYIGSTTDFEKRKSVHKLRTRNVESFHSPLYKTIRGLGGWDQFEMSKIETLDCETRREAETREAYWIQQRSGNMNTYMRTGMKKDRRDYCAKYYRDNREAILAYTREKYSYVKMGE